MNKCRTLLILSLSVLLLTASMPLSFAQGSNPIAENLEISTYRGVAVGGKLSATDPDGDAVTYQITTDPVKGCIELDDDGHFVYTPDSGKRGKDYFGYRATDLNGNRSQEATVIIRIEKQKSKVTYSDLAGQDCGYAAIHLADENLFVGECFAGTYVFDPAQPMSRAEFLTLCMKVTGHTPDGSDTSTGFADDTEIDAWAKPYVCEALSCGIISGYEDEALGVMFDPDRNITVAEASVMLNRAANLTDAVAAWYSADEALPVWAASAAANVSSCGLLPYGCRFTDAVLTRGSAAIILSNTMDTLKKR